MLIESFDIIKTVDGRYGCNWWLRTPTKFSGVAEFVFDSGAICEEGRNVYNNSECCGVRPVIVIKI